MDSKTIHTLLGCRPESAEIPPWSIFSSIIHQRKPSVTVFHTWFVVEPAIQTSGACLEGLLSLQNLHNLGNQPPGLP